MSIEALIADLACNGGVRIHIWPVERGFQANVSTDTASGSWTISTKAEVAEALRIALTQRIAALGLDGPVVPPALAVAPADDVEDLLGCL